MVLTLSSPGRVSAWAANVAQDGTIAGPVISLREDATVVSIHFGCPLSELGLAEGPIPLRSTPVDNVPLPRALGLQALDIEAGQPTEWRTIPEVPSNVSMALLRLPLDGPGGCETEVSTLRLEGIRSFTDIGRATFALRLRSNRMLVGTALGRFLLVNADASTEQVSLVDVGPVIAGFEDPDDTIWVLARDGRIASGRIGGTWEIETSTVPMSPQPEDDLVIDAKLVGRRSEQESFALYAAVADRTLARFDGTEWTDLSVTSRVDRIEHRTPTLAWLGDGRVLAGGVARNPNDVIEAEGTSVSEFELFGDDNDYPTFMHGEADGAVLIGTNEGALGRFRNGAFDSLGNVRRVVSGPMLDLDNRLVVGTRTRFLSASFQWVEVDGGEDCRLPPSNIPLVVQVLPSQTNQWLLVANQSAFDDRSDVGLFRLRAESPAGAVCPGGTITLQPPSDE